MFLHRFYLQSMWRCCRRYIIVMIQISTLITVHQLKILQYMKRILRKMLYITV
jgi:hypothetical protein